MDIKKQHYCDRMGGMAVLRDKGFFLDHVQPKGILDFGCADASFLLELRIRGWHNIYVGYDADAEMIERAKEVTAGDDNCFFFSDLEEAKHFMRQTVPVEWAIFFSSVFHEFSREEKKFFTSTLKNILIGAPYKYLIIRDMGIYKEQRFSPYDLARMDKDANVLEHGKHDELFTHYLGQPFFNPHGENARQGYETLLKFFLTYRYHENWEKEMKEEYLSLYLEEILETMKRLGLKPVYFRHFVHPYTKVCVERDFRVENFSEKTHYEAIFEI